MKVYIVQGTCGEYSDRDEWVACAYLDKAKAEQRVLELEEWVREVKLKLEGISVFGEEGETIIKESLKDKRADKSEYRLICFCKYCYSYFLTETEILDASMIDPTGWS